MKETIKKVLLKYCEPKIHGMSASEIADIIYEALRDDEIDRLKGAD